MDQNRIILTALDNELHRIVAEMELSADEYSAIYARYPQSHVFFADDFLDEDDYESIGYVMDRDVSRKIEWATKIIAALQDPRAREDETEDLPAGILFGAEGMADALACEAAERRMGC